jgi:hypothetical protein
LRVWVVTPCLPPSRSVARSPKLRVVPLVAGSAAQELTDPDGNLVRIVPT